MSSGTVFRFAILVLEFNIENKCDKYFELLPIVVWLS